jgi:hypothetical protein
LELDWRSGLKAHFGNQIPAVAAKALLVHLARRDGRHPSEVGWGALPEDVESLVVCSEGEATIVYQGVLEPSRFMRFYIPEPAGASSLA